MLIEPEAVAAAKVALSELLVLLEVSYLIDREGWEATRPWEDCLSLGEQQCISFARMFWTAPQFAGAVEALIIDMPSQLINHDAVHCQ